MSRELLEREYAVEFSLRTDGVDGSVWSCKDAEELNMSVKETIMHQWVRIGMYTAKKVFQLHGVDAQERVALNRKLSRHQMIRFFEKLY